MRYKILLGIALMLMMVMSVSGLEILSSSQISFNADNPDLNQRDAFIITGVENGGASYVTYSLSDLEKGLPFGYELDGTGNIKSSISNQRITFPIETKGSIYSIQQVCEPNGNCEYTSTIFNADSNQWCDNLITSQNDGFFTSANFQSLNYRCYQIIEVGKYADIQTGQHKFTETLTVTANGESDTVVLTDSDRVGSKKIGSKNNIVAKFDGLLGNTNLAPRPDIQRDAYFDSKTNNWHITRLLETSPTGDAYSSVYSYNSPSDILPIFNDCMGSGGQIGLYDNDLCYRYIQGQVDELTQEVSFTDSQIVGTTSSNGELVLTSNKIYEYPVISLTIDAEWIGITSPVGVPNIINIDYPDKFIEGENNKINVETKNVGAIDGSFIFAWSCESPFDIVQDGSPIQFTAGQSKTISFDVTGQTNTGCSTGSCRLVVKDYNDPTSSDEQTINLKVCESNQCTESGLQRCNNLDAQICIEQNGVLVWSTQSTCLKQCVLEGGIPVCKDETAPVCGNNRCESGERYESGEFYCPYTEQTPDCIPPIPPKPNNIIIIVSIIGGAGLLGAIGLRLKKDGYFGGKN